MASGSGGNVAILAIQPQYAEAIISGHKKVEFRKKTFRRKVEYVVMYVSNPIKKIIGFFRVSHITEASPAELWSRFQEVGGITKHTFQEYYNGVTQAVAIGIDEIVVLRRPLSLETLCGSLAVPQSFVYLPKDLFELIKKELRKK
jgi:predicted transcriptional regulator